MIMSSFPPQKNASKKVNGLLILHVGMFLLLSFLHLQNVLAFGTGQLELICGGT